jgi:uncharacterized membrane protein YhaH (DUF805 family)
VIVSYRHKSQGQRRGPDEFGNNKLRADCVSFTESIKTCFQKYIDFNGRASRSEYWWFFLFSFIVSVALSIVAMVAFFLTFLEWIFALVILLPSLAVTVRRLHDTNRPAWWLLLLVPPVGFIGWIPLLIFCVLPGTPGANRYGSGLLQPQQGMGGFGYTQSGHPYDPPPAGGYGAAGYGAAQPEPSPESDTDERRFCTVCGTAV